MADVRKFGLFGSLPGGGILIAVFTVRAVGRPRATCGKASPVYTVLRHTDLLLYYFNSAVPTRGPLPGAKQGVEVYCAERALLLTLGRGVYGLTGLILAGLCELAALELGTRPGGSAWLCWPIKAFKSVISGRPKRRSGSLRDAAKQAAARRWHVAPQTLLSSDAAGDDQRPLRRGSPLRTRRLSSSPERPPGSRSRESAGPLGLRTLQSSWTIARRNSPRGTDVFSARALRNIGARRALRPSHRQPCEPGSGCWVHRDPDHSRKGAAKLPRLNIIVFFFRRLTWVAPHHGTRAHAR